MATGLQTWGPMHQGHRYSLEYEIPGPPNPPVEPEPDPEPEPEPPDETVEGGEGGDQVKVAKTRRGRPPSSK